MKSVVVTYEIIIENVNVNNVSYVRRLVSFTL